MHVGFSAVFAAPAGRPRPSVEALCERAAGRLHEVPWCRWRLDPAPLGLSEPRWIDDVEFDLSAHIVALTPPDDRVSHASFEALRSTVLSAPLDRSRARDRHGPLPLFFGCYADPDVLPDVHQLPALVEAELQELGRSATHGRADGAQGTPHETGPRRPAARSSGN
jgi:hypothetical protein